MESATNQPITQQISLLIERLERELEELKESSKAATGQKKAEIRRHKKALAALSRTEQQP